YLLNNKSTYPSRCMSGCRNNAVNLLPKKPIRAKKYILQAFISNNLLFLKYFPEIVEEYSESFNNLGLQ
ncbi:MAG: hypothetical protein OEY26_01375, partial [Nitrospinota bacterium]|nr:hypothetical protein [Nitrospinota bacterium]